METKWLVTEYQSIWNINDIINIHIEHHDNGKDQICAKIKFGMATDTYNITKYYDSSIIESVYMMLLNALSIGDRLIDVEQLITAAEAQKQGENDLPF